MSAGQRVGLVVLLTLGTAVILIGLFSIGSNPPDGVKKEWDPFALVQTGLGLLVAAFFQVTLARGLDRDRRTRDLVQREIDSARDKVVDAVEKLAEFGRGAASHADVVRAAQRASMALSLVSDMLNEIGREGVSAWAAELERRMFVLRKALTENATTDEAGIATAEHASQRVRFQLFEGSKTYCA